MLKPFASQGDLAEKKITFRKISDHAYSYEAESDPTSGVIVGDDGVIVVDARATPAMAQDVIEKVRSVTDLPIKYIILTHYHAVRVLGASAYKAEQIICSEMALEMIRERGEADFKSEVERFPRLFRNVETVPGLTYPTMTFASRMTLWLGKTEVRLAHIGRGHTRGDIIVTLPADNVIFSGDLVENGASVYMGDGHAADWLRTLDGLREMAPGALVPGRGAALLGEKSSRDAIDLTQNFIRTIFESVRSEVAKGHSLRDAYHNTRKIMDPEFGSWPVYEHCIPFDVARCYDEAKGIDNPRIWTAERDRELWSELQG